MELRKYLEIIYKRWAVVAVCVVVVLAGALAAAFLTSPVYKSEAKLYVRMTSLQQKFIKGFPNEIGKYEYSNQENAMGTIEEMVENRNSLAALVEEMDFRDSKGRLLKVESFVNPNNASLVFSQKKGVSIENIKDTDVIMVTGYSDVLEESQAIADKVVSNFISSFAEMYRNEAKAALKSIDARFAEVERDFLDAERRMVDFRLKRGIYNEPNQVTTLLGVLANAESEIDKTRRAMEESKATIESIKKAAISSHLDLQDAQVKIAENSTIEEYKKQIISTETVIVKLLLERTEEHPEVKAARRQLDLLKSALQDEVQKSLASQIVEKPAFYDALSSKYSSALTSLYELEAREKALLSQTRQYKKELDKIPQKEKDYDYLVRELDNLKMTYSNLYSSRETAREAVRLDMANAFVFQPAAIQPELKHNVHFPKKKSILIIAGVVSVFLGLFLAFAREYTDETIWGVGEFEKISDAPAGAIRYSKALKDGGVFKGGPGQISDSVGDLVTRIKLSRGRALGNTISIVSVSDGDGKTLVAAALGNLLAAQGKKTVIVDCDLRARSGNTLVPTGLKGLSDVLAENVGSNAVLRPVTSGKTPASGLEGAQDAADSGSWRNAFVTTALSPGLDVISSGTAAVAFAQGALDSPRFSAFAERLSAAYDHVIFDTPSLSVGNDAMLLSGRSEETIFVAAQRKTRTQSLRRHLEAFRRAGLDISGSVLNKARYPFE